jgi:hypothetical protein
MSIVKVPSGSSPPKNHALARGAAAKTTAEDEWFEPETTQVDARIEDRSDWARPIDPHAVAHIGKLVEEELIAVPLSPIEDHRAAPPPPEPEPAATTRPQGSRKMLIIVAALAAAGGAAWFLVQSHVIRF